MTNSITCQMLGNLPNVELNFLKSELFNFFVDLAGNTTAVNTSILIPCWFCGERHFKIVNKAIRI